jgi:Replication protein C N-terminal domain
VAKPASQSTGLSSWFSWCGSIEKQHSIAWRVAVAPPAPVRFCYGQIVKAYSFDLSPIAARHAEFVRLAEEAREERELMGRLRRRATIARKGIAQILETAAEYCLQGEEWSQLARDIQGLALALKRPESPEVMALGVSRAWSGARRRHASV